jgi:hypothetical protein
VALFSALFAFFAVKILPAFVLPVIIVYSPKPINRKERRERKIGKP